MKKKLIALIALFAAFTLVFSACGSKDSDTPAYTGPEILDLNSWDMYATTWSSPNGATVHFTGVPAGYAQGQTATFVVRLEGEDVDSVPCEFDGQTYTASSDLNGADGYCYYLLMESSDGSRIELPVNTPTEPFDTSLINLASSLESYCSVVVETSSFDGKWMTITSGSIQVQAPRIANADTSITCSKTELVMSLNGEEIQRVALEMPAADENGTYTLALTDVAFEVTGLSEDDDQQLTMDLNVTLSNGQVLSAPGATWLHSDGTLMLAVG